MRFFKILTLLLSISAPHALSLDCGNFNQINCQPQDLFILEGEGTESYYKGLSPSGIEAFKRLRGAIRSRFKLFGNEYRRLDNVHHAATVARLFKGNMFLYGPPGGAKSSVVKWMFKGEEGGVKSAFQIQLHQMLTETAFIGGQDFTKAREGQFEVNTKGSIADFQVALVDEFEKGNPAALSALLSLLNEREILAGNKVVKAKTETIFATSNANLPEIFDQFLESGQRSTAPALLNRFQFKAFVYNWLPEADQEFLDERFRRVKRFQALAKVLVSNPSLTQHQDLLSPEKVDWETARLLAELMIEFNSHFGTTYRSFTKALREETNNAILESEQKYKMNSQDEPFRYFPSGDLTERLRQPIPQIIKFSFFIDLLLSDQANDENLGALSSKVIELGPLSLWRAYLVMTTVSLGKASLKFEEGSSKASINFGLDFNKGKARDSREALLMRHLKEEQDRFSRLFGEQMSEIANAVKSIAPFSFFGRNVEGQLKDDIEVLLLGK